MNLVYKQSIVYIILITFLVGCGIEKKTHAVKFFVETSTKEDNELKITVTQNLEQNILAEVSVDSTSGNGFVVFQLAKPTFANIQIGNLYAEVYLTPNSELTAHLDIKNPDNPVEFSGEGSEANNYLSEITSIVDKMKRKNGVYYGQVGIDEFFQRFDSLEAELNNLQQDILENAPLPNDEIQLLLKVAKIKLQAISQEYYFMLTNNALFEQRELMRQGKKTKDFIFPERLKNITAEVPYDTVLLNLGCPDYFTLLDFHLMGSIYYQNYLKNLSTPLLAIEVNFDKDIRNGNYPSGFKEYWLAKNIHYWLTLLGITPTIDALFKRFQTDYKHSRYLGSLQKLYNEWLGLSVGNLAPDFTGKAIDNNTISLSELKGKIVYADVWATWCAPCIEEIPHAKELQKQFDSNNEIVFLNVSVDRDVEVWKRFISKDKAWKGIHINLQGSQVDQFWEVYKISGVPTYILIDQGGKIVNTKAPRPSSPELLKDLNRLLSSK